MVHQSGKLKYKTFWSLVNIANLVDPAKYTKRNILYQNSSCARDAISIASDRLISKKNPFNSEVHVKY
jgi:hypothetical protein